MPCFADWIGRLQRCKWLQHFQIFDARYLITLDGSRYFSSDLCPLPDDYQKRTTAITMTRRPPSSTPTSVGAPSRSRVRTQQ